MPAPPHRLVIARRVENEPGVIGGGPDRDAAPTVLHLGIVGRVRHLGVAGDATLQNSVAVVQAGAHDSSPSGSPLSVKSPDFSLASCFFACTSSSVVPSAILIASSQRNFGCFVRMVQT